MYFEFEMSINNAGNECDSKQTNTSNNNNNNDTNNVQSSILNHSSFLSPRTNNQFSSTSCSLSLSSSSSSDSSSISSHQSFTQMLSPLAVATNQSSTPIKSIMKSSISPPPPTIPKHRRYSVHSSQSLFTIDSLYDNSNVTFCDLALIAKKKLLQLNGSYIKSFSENNSLSISPDTKLTSQPFNKHNNNDLRREVLLASIQRSLSASSEDLYSLSTTKSVDDDDDDGSTNEESSMDIVVQSSSSPNQINIKSMVANHLDHQPHNINPLTINSISNLNDELMNDLSSCHLEMRRLQFPSRIKARRSQSVQSYTPSGNQNNCMSSLTTFTSTTSMAGCKNINGNNNLGRNNNNNNPNNCHNSNKSIKLNVSGLNLITGNSASSAALTTYSSSPKLASMAMSSSPFNSASPLKKRLHSTSPSKYSPSPYHTVANSICKDFNLIFSQNSNPIYQQQLQQHLSSSDWDIAFKRLKVMHCGSGPGGDESANSNSTGASHNISSANLIQDTLSSGQLDRLNDCQDGTPNHSHLHPVRPQQFNSGGPIHNESPDLNDLTQDFNRLKTPFI